MAALLAANVDLWRCLAAHPFVTAAGDGSLPVAAFDRWLVEDHHFVVSFRRFLARLVALAPDEPARDLLAGGLTALTPELQLFRSEAAARELDLGGEPSPTGLGYASYLHAACEDGFVAGLTVLYGAERAYLDAWRAVRSRAATGSPYWRFIDNWSSTAFGDYVDALGRLLDRLTPAAPPVALARSFRTVVRFELRFWDAVHAGETWADLGERPTTGW